MGMSCHDTNSSLFPLYFSTHMRPHFLLITRRRKASVLSFPSSHCLSGKEETIFCDIIEGGGALNSPSAQKMGAGASYSSNSKRVYGKGQMRSFREKVGQLQEEIAAMMKERQRERESYQRDAMAFATKEAEWRKERRKLREELRRLRTMEGSENQSPQLERMVLGERMTEERARQDEAVDRWKQLYLAIKTELGDLIRSVRYGSKADEEKVVVGELRKEALEREAMIASLGSREASLEQEKVKLEREVDILRQSLRIIIKQHQHQ